MALKVGIPVAGEMGAGLGRRLVEHGAEVFTVTEGRSAATVARARAAGLQPTDLAGVCACDVVLSITPPAVAPELARAVAGLLQGAGHRPVYADLNAVSPQTAVGIAAVIEAAGARFVDGGIIGLPPEPGKAGPLLCLSGDAAGALATLGEHGLRLRMLEGGVGAASALKMCYGALTKGVLALGGMLLLAAERDGIGEDYVAELARSQGEMLERLRRFLPDMYPKAYRWVAEMEEISAFLEPGTPASDVYAAIARFYAEMAADQAGPKARSTAIRALISPLPTA